MNAMDIAMTYRLRIQAVGSRVTCDPAPVGTDQDWLVRAKDETHFQTVVSALIADGWEPCSPLDYGSVDDWVAYRKGEDNIVLTWTDWLWDSFVASTAAAKRLNLLSKEDRRDLFEIIRQAWPREYGNTAMVQFV